jgi:hypothetical protein
MRRIIERTVTVVTTTVWKISWQDDPTPSDPSAPSIVDQFREPVISSETVQRPEQFPPVTEEKEVDLWVEKPVTNPVTIELPDEPYFNHDEERKGKP